MRLKNPTTPVRLGEQRFDTFRAQHPLKMGNCKVNVLRRIGTHPRGCSRGDVHCVLSLRHIDFLTDGVTRCVGLPAHNAISQMFSTVC